MTPYPRLRRTLCSALLGLGLSGCVTVQGGDKPVQLEGTFNVNFKVQKEVDKSLDYLDAAPGQTPQPTTAATGSQAETKEQVLARIKQRLPALKQAKASGTVGEAATGYLEAVNASGDGDISIRDLIHAQNADRRKLYSMVAAETSTTPAAVAQQFAQRFADRAAKGDYLKGPDGVWHPKP